MKYKLILTDKYLKKGIDRLFDLIKIDSSDWLPNEDLVQMIASIQVSDYKTFFECVINNDDFTFLEYSQIFLSKDELNGKGIHNQDMIFMLFDDYFKMPKLQFRELIIQLCEILISSNDVIRNEYNIRTLDLNFLINKKEQLSNASFL